MIKKIISLSFILIPFFTSASNCEDSTALPTQKIYLEKNGDSFFCMRPKTFDFAKNIPVDFYGYVKQSFQKKNLPKVAAVAASTAVLIIFDQQITDGMQHFFHRNGISAEEDYTPIVQVNLLGKKTNLGKWPGNANTFFYNIGQGSSVVLAAAGFFIAGKIKNDNRALQTSSQLIESFLALGISTQIMKYSTGRESPSQPTAPGGRWSPFPSISNFQNDKPRYDAFPSGHLATFVSAVTIIAQNYPNVKWIGPVGYSVAGLISLAMINNGAHWAGDYPLGFALGYGFGKFITKKNHIQLKTIL